MNPRITALITGASSGIGEVFAREIAARKSHNVIIIAARRFDRLTKLKDELSGNGVTILPLQTDLTLASERSRIFEFVQKENLLVSLLINNAGFGSVGGFYYADAANEQNMVALNCIAPLHLTHLFLPSMRNHGGGSIINVSSIAGMQPMPYMATYGATKAFLTSFSVALNTELTRYNIHVQALCPGPTESEFHLVAGLPEKMDNLPAMTAEAVVRLSLDSLLQKRPIVVPGLLNNFLTQLNRFISRNLAAKIVEQILRRRLKNI